MIITNEILYELTEKAKASPRLRANLDLRNSPDDLSQRMLNALEPGIENGGTVCPGVRVFVWYSCFGHREDRGLMYEGRW